MTIREAEELLAETAAKLGEHFEAVQILATWSEEGLSMCSKRGAGNFYARLGMAREFIQMNEADNLANEIAAQNNKDTE